MPLFSVVPQQDQQNQQDPAVQQLVQLMHQNPQLAQMLSQNPQMVQQIESNPQMLQQLMSHMQQGNQTNFPQGMFDVPGIDKMDRRSYNPSMNPQLNSYINQQQKSQDYDLKSDIQKYLNTDVGKQVFRNITGAVSSEQSQDSSIPAPVQTGGVQN